MDFTWNILIVVRIVDKIVDKNVDKIFDKIDDALIFEQNCSCESIQFEGTSVLCQQ